MKTTRAVTRAVAFAAALVMSALMLATPAGATVSNWGYVSTTTYGTCTLASTAIYTTGGHGASIDFQSYGAAEGPQSCTNTNFQVAPDHMSIQQNIQFSIDNGYLQPWQTCNTGPRVANDWYWANSVATSWTVPNIVAACAFAPGSGYVRIQEVDYAFDPFTNLWEGGVFYSPSQYMS